MNARNLAKMDLNGKADPYVVLLCGKERHTTQVAYKTLTPSWDEEFRFDRMSGSTTTSSAVPSSPPCTTR